jgi:hypothetical protein
MVRQSYDADTLATPDYEGMFLLCYVRGPEGLIVELAERLNGAPA